MNRLTAASAAALTIAVLVQPASATAAANSAVTSIPVDPATQIEMHVNADCAGARCTFSTTANLLAPDGPTGFPGDAWSRQTITLRSSTRSVWQEATYSAPSGMPRDNKGQNHDNVLSKLYKSLDDVEISITTFGGGPIERYTIDGESVPTDWRTGQPNTNATPTACATTTFRPGTGK